MPTTACSSSITSALGRAASGLGRERRRWPAAAPTRAPARSCSGRAARQLADLAAALDPAARRAASPGRRPTATRSLHDLGAGRERRPAATAAAHAHRPLAGAGAAQRRTRTARSSSVPDRADGTRRAIVDIPGTKSWNPLPNPDVTSLTTNVPRAGRRDDRLRGRRARRDAPRRGDAATTRCMLVGHSEGGMVAVNAARDAARIRPVPRHPRRHRRLADRPHRRRAARVGCRCSRWRTAATSCPHLDGAANPDRPNVTTVDRAASSTVQHRRRPRLRRRRYLPVAADGRGEPQRLGRRLPRPARHGFLDGTSRADPRVLDHPQASEPAALAATSAPCVDQGLPCWD